MVEITRINIGAHADSTGGGGDHRDPHARCRVRVSHSCLLVCMCSGVSVVLPLGVLLYGPLVSPLVSAYTWAS